MGNIWGRRPLTGDLVFSAGLAASPILDDGRDRYPLGRFHNCGFLRR